MRQQDAALVGGKRKERRMLNLKDPAKRAEWVYGQPMAPCPKCGSYNMKPQIPIAMETTGDETAPQLVGKWARATKAGHTPLQGPAYYACWDCFHKGPAVDCTGRTSEDCRADRALNAEMKRLWNAQTPNVYHPLESDGVAILDVTEAKAETITMADDDGWTATNADGSEKVRKVFVLGGGHAV
jgi:hypothetical protein